MAKKAPRKKSGLKKAAPKKTKKPARSKAKPTGKLSRAKLRELETIVNSKSFDSDAAMKLDYALFDAVDKGVPLDYFRFAEVPEIPAQYWAAWWLDGEVKNGGFHQFFLNKGPQVALVAQRFLKANGPADVARMLDAAIKKFPGSKLPTTYDGMMAVLVNDDLDEDERFMAAMSKIDDRFFERDGDMIEDRLRFALAHREVFFKVE